MAVIHVYLSLEAQGIPSGIARLIVIKIDVDRSQIFRPILDLFIKRSLCQDYRKLLTPTCRRRPLFFSRTTAEPRLSLTVATPLKLSGTSSISIMYLVSFVLLASSHLYVDAPNRLPFVTVARRGMGNGVVLNSQSRQSSRHFHGA